MAIPLKSLLVHFTCFFSFSKIHLSNTRGKINRRGTDVQGERMGGGEGWKPTAIRFFFLIFEDTIFRKEQKLSVAVYLSSAKMFIFQLCVHHF